MTIFLQDCETGRAYCQSIICNFTGNLNKDEFISLKFYARVWNWTLNEVLIYHLLKKMNFIINAIFKDYKGYKKVLIKTNGQIVLNGNVLDEDLSDNLNTVATIAYPNKMPDFEENLPIDVIIVSVLIGISILVISIIGFWMVN